MRLTFCLLILTQTVFTQLTYDKGTATTLNSMQGPISLTNSITFTNIFQKVPQIIIQFSTISVNSNQNEIQFQVISVTLTNFQYKVVCPYNLMLSKYYFDWLAIVEDRIQVLNPSKETTVANGTIYTYTHTLPQVTQAFVILNSFGYSVGGFDFQVSVYSVSDTNVKIQLLTSSTKLQSIGYQIILGTKDAFYTTNIQKTGSGTDILGQYTVKKLQNSILFYPYIGFSWNGYDNIRLQLSSTIISSDYQYTYSTFFGTTMQSLTFQSIQFFTQILFPYYAKKYKVSKQSEEFPTNQISVNFIEINQSYNSETQQTINLLSSQSQLNVEIQIALPNGKKVRGQILKCNECGNNNKHIINQPYFSKGSFLKYRIQLLQYTNSVSTLVFSMTSNQIQIQQVINQVVDTVDILQFEIMNV